LKTTEAKFLSLGNSVNYWTADNANNISGYYAYNFELGFNRKGIKQFLYKQQRGFSVRCVKD
jgi:uncharacterized protein (TIGR02145 family)